MPKSFTTRPREELPRRIRRTGTRWSASDVETLLSLVSARTSPQVIALSLRRTTQSVQRMIQRLQRSRVAFSCGPADYAVRQEQLTDSTASSGFR